MIFCTLVFRKWLTISVSSAFLRVFLGFAFDFPGLFSFQVIFLTMACLVNNPGLIGVIQYFSFYIDNRV